MRACVLFDLDDTLYPEADFVRSGLRAVAAALEARAGLPALHALAVLERALEEHGRGRTFDHALAALGLTDPALVPELVRIYRAHPPTLTLHPDALRALDRLAGRGLPLGLVTDGDPTVQRAKVRALGLERWVGSVAYTWDAGPERQKPDPSGYLRALTGLGVPPERALYVGDDPAKDFAGARSLGLATVRVLRGRHAAVQAVPGAGADAEIASLDGLEDTGLV